MALPRSRSAALPFLLCLLHLAVGLESEDEGADGTEGRLVVVPDVHGDIEALRGALALAGLRLQDQDSPVLPGNITTLVSLGDLVDRGPDGPACYAVLASLARSAPGRVQRLLGNHEWLNLLGVDASDHPDTPSVQESLLASYVHRTELQTLGGWPGRWEAFTPAGELGGAIARDFELLTLLPRPWDGPAGTLPPLQAAATLFLHGGITAATAQSYQTAAELAKEAKEQLKQWLAGGGPDALLPGRGGEGTDLFDELLQDRSLAQGDEAEVCPELEAVLTHFKAARLVLGHTPQLGGLRYGLASRARRASVRCAGRLVLLDVGMSRWLLSMQRPERAPHSAVLELRYQQGRGPDLLTGLRVLYALPELEEQVLPPFSSHSHSDL